MRVCALVVRAYVVHMCLRKRARRTHAVFHAYAAQWRRLHAEKVRLHAQRERLHSLCPSRLTAGCVPLLQAVSLHSLCPQGERLYSPCVPAGSLQAVSRYTAGCVPPLPVSLHSLRPQRERLHSLCPSSRRTTGRQHPVALMLAHTHDCSQTNSQHACAWRPSDRRPQGAAHPARAQHRPQELIHLLLGGGCQQVRCHLVAGGLGAGELRGAQVCACVYECVCVHV